MKFYITGGTGFIGSRLCSELKQLGHEPVVLGRDNAQWPEFVREYCIINLAGSSIFTRFTKQAKQQIYSSRINTTKNIFVAIKKSGQKPTCLVSASAVGYYGNGGNELLSEDSSPGTDFLAKVCVDWETAAMSGCNELGIRCVLIRTGYVLGNGGMLGQLLPLFKLGLGGKLSGGKQYMPWISHQDIAGLYIFAALNNSANGPINASAPETVTNAEFTKQLAAYVNRPAIFTVPKFALKLLFGELGELMLYSQKTSNQKLLALGFKFNQSTLLECFKELK